MLKSQNKSVWPWLRTQPAVTLPQFVILDCEGVFSKLHADIGRLTGMMLDWDAFFSQVFDLPHIKTHRRITGIWNGGLREEVHEMAFSDVLFEHHTLTRFQQVELETVIYRAALHIKNYLLDLDAYHLGVFPYTFRTTISDGCLLFSKNEHIYDSNVPYP